MCGISNTSEYFGSAENTTIYLPPEREYGIEEQPKLQRICTQMHALLTETWAWYFYCHTESEQDKNLFQ